MECKFDGDRIQVHKNGNDIHFFSRFISSKFLLWTLFRFKYCTVLLPLFVYIGFA